MLFALNHQNIAVIITPDIVLRQEEREAIGSGYLFLWNTIMIIVVTMMMIMKNEP